VICPACSEKNRDGARFCTFCGTTLALRCQVCDTELISGARFCDACGAAVDQSLEVHEPAPVASRKVVTVLFADLTGSTALEERMDVESVRAILDRFYASMRTEVERHGGRVVKFTGDGLMAAFGVPDVREDDAERAIDTALAMRNELEQLASDLSLDLSLKVGVNTGEVVVSDTDEDVVGDAVNVASRLEGAAAAGQIIVGEDTWRLTRGTSRYEPIEPLTLKGKSEPVPAYTLLAVDERTADSAAAPFVGREAELGKLLRAFEDAVESNAARIVTIIGSPGLGKTRLSRELMSELADVARVRETRCDPAGSAPFEPIADALRAAVGISETDTEADVIEKLTARIDEDDRDRDRIGMRAAAILGVGLAGTTEETFWAVRRLIEAAASTQPVVLVIDDLHWADPLMLDLIEHLAEFIQDAPVLLIGTARPELRDLRPSLVEGGRTATVIALEGLDRSATAQLALNLLGTDELPAELLAKIPASTEGNPLFVRELVRMLVDDRVLLRTADGWSVTVDVDAIQVPPTISSLLSARVDRLRNDERTILELASVVGKEFYRGALKDLAPPPLRDLVDGVLESLRRKELVEPVGTYWIDEPVYRFHHVLIRDAAYRRLLKESRADLHERVADWLERKTEGVLGEHDEVIGYHLEQAVEYKTQLAHESAALAQRAAEFLGGAAQRALDRDDLPSAASFSGRALALLPEDEERRAGLLLIHCEAVLSMGDATHGAEAVAEFESLANTPRLSAWATCFSGQLANLTAPERLQDTEARVAAAASDLTELGDLAGAAKAHTVHASTLAALCRFADCEAVLDKALNAARDAGDKRRITAALGSTPHAALWGPNPVSRAGGRCLDIVRLLRITTGSPAVEATSRRCQAVLEAFRGRSDAARGMLRSARRVYTELGLEHELLAAEQFSGIVELVAGDAAAAEEHLRAAHDGFRKVGVDVLAAQSAAMLARAHLLLGEVAEAEACVGTGEQLGSQDLKTAIAVRSVRAELLARRGEFDEAKQLAEEAVALAERTDALIDHGNACRSLAAVYRAAGDANRARSADDRATALFERKGATALTEGRVAAHAAPASASETSTSPELTNRCTRVRDRFLQLFATRQWSAFANVVAEDCLFDDRRVGLRHTARGPEGLVETLKPAAESGTARFDTETIAIRGENLSLTRTTARGRGGPAGLETEFLSVQELDADGRYARIVDFDPDDLVAAFDELDDRFTQGEGVGTAFAAASRTNRLINKKDWDAARPFIAEDLVVVDRRPASLGTLNGREDYIQALSELQSLIPNLYLPAVALPVIDESGGVGHIVGRGTTPEGAEVNVEFHMVVIVGDDKLLRLEYYPVDQLDAAIARYRELTDGLLRSTVLSNGVSRLLLRSEDFVNRRDVAGAAALHSADLVRDDRRSGFQDVTAGRDELFGNLTTIADGENQVHSMVVATRGEQLALVSTHWDLRRGYQIDYLGVVESGPDDLIARIVFFDTDALDAAFAELDARYARGEAVPFSDVWQRHIDGYAAYNARDWDQLRSLLTDDYVFIDHRPVSLGRLDGPDAVIEMYRAAIELAPDVRSRVAVIHDINANGALYENRAGGTFGGSDVEIRFISATIHRDGKMALAEVFPIDQLDAARSRFLELTRVASTGPANSATRALALVLERFSEDRLDDIASLCADDFVRVDHRQGLGDQLDRNGFVESLTQTRALGLTSIGWAPIATRGDRLGLGRIFVTDAAGNGLEFLAISEVDVTGLLTHGAYFDLQDVEGAFEELDGRYLAGEGAPFSEIVRINAARVRANNARDWDEYEATFYEDAVLVDHMLGGATYVGATAIAEYTRTIVDVAGDYPLYMTEILAIDSDRMLSRTLRTGTTPDGAHVEIEFLGLYLRRGDRFARIERFSPDQRALALRRFDKLGPQPQGLDNACLRLIRRQWEFYVSEDWDAIAALFETDHVTDDRRPGLQMQVTGPHGVVENLKALRAVGGRNVATTAIATRGHRLALYRFHVMSAERRPGDFETEALVLNELGSTGRLGAGVVFEPDDVDAALAELDERYLATLDEPAAGRLENVATRTAMRYSHTLYAKDWDALGQLMTEDSVWDDRRPGLRSVVRGREARLENTKAIVAIGVTRAEYTPIALRGDRLALARNVLRGDADSIFEAEVLMVTEVDDQGRVTATVVLDVGDVDAAFDELDGRYLAGEGRPCADIVRLGFEGSRIYNDRDWDAYADFFNDDMVMVDRRPAGAGTISGRGELVRYLQTLIDMAPGARMATTEVPAVAGDRVLMRLRVHGTTPEGAEIELAFYVLYLMRAGRFSRMEVFLIEQRNQALARFDELGPQRDLENEATRAMERISLAGKARAWEEIERLVADQPVQIDRRLGLRAEGRGRRDTIRTHRMLAEGGWYDAARLEPIAIRGNRLALIEGTLTNPEDLEIYALTVIEVEEDGRVSAVIYFDPDDIDAAFAELNERYAAGEGTINSDFVRNIAAYQAAYNARDWDRVREVAGENFVAVDHRPASIGEIHGGDEVVAYAAPLIEQAPDTRFEVVSIPALTRDGAVIETRTHGTSAGGPVEIRYLVAFTRDRVDFYPLDRLDLALARLAQPHPELENECSRVTAEAFRRWKAGDLDGGMTFYADDAVIEDRRRGLGAVVRREGIFDNLRGWAEAGFEQFEVTPVAIRGERFMLLRILSGDRTGLESEFVLTHELTDDGCIVRCVTFDVDDVDSAYAELDARYVETEGAFAAEFVSQISRVTLASNADDWDTMIAGFAPDVHFVDHRPAYVGELHGRDEMLGWSRSFHEVTRERRSEVVAYHALAPTCAVIRLVQHATTLDDVTTETTVLTVTKMQDGLFNSVEYFAPDDLDRALERFEELSAAPTPLENRALRTAHLQNRCILQGDWEAAREYFASDVVEEDRRAGLGTRVVGLDAVLDSRRAIVAIGVERIEYTPIATRGERLILVRGRFRGPADSAFEAEGLVLVEVDEAGRETAVIAFDPDDLDAAIAELDERYIAGEGAAFQDILRAMFDGVRAANEGDWSAVRSSLADDLTLTDHRPVALGDVRGADVFIATQKEFLALANFKAFVRTVPAVATDRILFEMWTPIKTHDGSSYEIGYYVLAQWQGGVTTRAEFFPFDRLDDALARFHELESPTMRPAGGVAENAAWARVTDVLAALKSSDWSTASARAADDLFLEDRRPGLRSSVRGRDAGVGHLRSIYASGVVARTVESLLATRGARLCLFRQHLVATNDFDIDLLVMAEVDSASQFVRGIFFEHDDLDGAYEELMERYIAGEGRPYEAMLRAAFDAARSYNAHDWDRLATHLDPNLLVVDHRPASAEQMSGPDDFIRYCRTFAELAPDVRLENIDLAVAPDRSCSHQRITGTSVDGAPVENLQYSVYFFHADRIERIELFADDARDAALACFAGSAKDPNAFEPDTFAVRTFRDKYAGGNWERFNQYDEDSVFEDRRPGMGVRIVGREANIENLEVSMRGVTLDWSVIAVRGEYLVVSALHASARSGFVVELLSLHEFTADEIQRTSITFDPSDLDAAIAELDARYIAGEGAPYAEMWGCVAALTDAYAKRDWDTFASLTSDDLVFVDHRPASLGRIEGTADLIRSQKALIDLVPEFHWQFVQIEAIDATGCVTRMQATTTDTEGGLIEFALYFVLCVRDGKLRNLEFFPLKHRDEALERHRELSDTTPPLENATTRLLARILGIMVRQAWNELPPLHRPDYRLEDRRSGLRSEIVGYDGVIENLKAAADMGMSRVERTVLAIRGERFALARMVGRGPADSEFEVELLEVTELADDGRIAQGVLLDAGAFDAAFAELTERFAASLSDQEASIVRANAAILDAYRERDWERFGSFLSPDFELFDHVPAAVGNVRGRDAYIEYVRSFTELVPNARIDNVRDVALAPNIGLAESVLRGTSEDGTDIEVTWLDLGQFRDDVLVCLEQFPVDQLEAARARFDELGAQRSSLQNACTRTMDRFFAVLSVGDWDAVAAFIPDRTYQDDRRTGLRNRSIGRDSVLENLRLVYPHSTVQRGTLAIRGDRLAISSLHIVTLQGFEVDLLAVTELDENGQFIAEVQLDPDDLDAAFAELDERYANGEGAAFAEPIRLASRLMRAVNGPDWDEIRATLSDDLVVVSHQPASLGEMHGPDEWMETQRALFGLLSEYRSKIARYLAGTPTCVLVEQFTNGVTHDGAVIEFANLVVERVGDGVIVHLEAFPVDRFDEAKALFDELSAPPSLLENGATRQAFRTYEVMATGDWDAAEALLTEDVELDDRRRVVGSRGRGRRAWINNFKAFLDLGFKPGPSELLATRGDHLALSRGIGTDPDGNEMSVIALNEVDDEGRASRIVWFDADDLDRAFTELDNRYLGSGLATDAERVMIRFIQAYNERDWTTARAQASSDVIFVDHRSAQRGTLHGDEYFEGAKALVDLAPDMRVRLLGVRHGVMITAGDGTDENGNRVQWDHLHVAEVRDDVFVRVDRFAHQDFDAAAARAEELAQPTMAVPENAAWTAITGTMSAGSREDWDEISARLTADFVVEDRRQGLVWRTQGRDVGVEMFRLVYGTGGGVNTRNELIATRGDRLCLSRWFVFAKDFEIETLLVVETDEAGVGLLAVLFDPTDIDSAFDELDERFIAGEGSAHADILRRAMAQRAAIRNRDWDAYRSLMDNDIVLVDHRPVSLGELRGVDAVLDALQALTPLVRDARPRAIAIHGLATDRTLIQMTASATDEHGGEVEMTHLRIQQYRDGLVVRVELFPITAFAVAKARFDELSREDVHDRLPLDNIATRRAVGYADAFRRRDWDALGDCYADDAVRIDLRSGLGSRLEGRDALINSARQTAALDFPALDLSPIATRGERLALFRAHFAREDAFVVDLLGLHEVDEDGRITTRISFDPDALDAAYGELTERFATGEAASCSDFVRRNHEATSALNAGDFDRFASTTTADLTFVDHRMGSSGAISGRDRFVEFVKGLSDVAADIRRDIVAYHAIDPQGGVAEFLDQGRNEAGGEVEIAYVQVMIGRLEDELLAAHVERFAVDQLDAALARFEELRREHPLGPQI
jgi:class 3 adenylate cyclase/ketosteroid isomerase-like protein/tetratricopeptide (TPR) repeat protein